MASDDVKALTAEITEAASRRREERIELTRLIYARKIVEGDPAKIAKTVRAENFGKVSSGEMHRLINDAIKSGRKKNKELLGKIKITEQRISELTAVITEAQQQIERLAFSEAAERLAAIINAEAAECSADAVSLLDDIIRKGWTASFYLCELGTPAIRLRRNRCTPIIIDARSTAALIVSAHLQLSHTKEGGES